MSLENHEISEKEDGILDDKEIWHSMYLCCSKYLTDHLKLDSEFSSDIVLLMMKVNPRVPMQVFITNIHSEYDDEFDVCTLDRGLIWGLANLLR